MAEVNFKFKFLNLVINITVFFPPLLFTLILIQGSYSDGKSGKTGGLGEIQGNQGTVSTAWKDIFFETKSGNFHCVNKCSINVHTVVKS